MNGNSFANEQLLLNNIWIQYNKTENDKFNTIIPQNIQNNLNVMNILLLIKNSHLTENDVEFYVNQLENANKKEFTLRNNNKLNLSESNTKILEQLKTIHNSLNFMKVRGGFTFLEKYPTFYDYIFERLPKVIYARNRFIQFVADSKIKFVADSKIKSTPVTTSTEIQSRKLTDDLKNTWINTQKGIYGQEFKYKLYLPCIVNDGVNKLFILLDVFNILDRKDTDIKLEDLFNEMFNMPNKIPDKKNDNKTKKNAPQSNRGNFNNSYKPNDILVIDYDAQQNNYIIAYKNRIIKNKTNAQTLSDKLQMKLKREFNTQLNIITNLIRQMYSIKTKLTTDNIQIDDFIKLIKQNQKEYYNIFNKLLVNLQINGYITYDQQINDNYKLQKVLVNDEITDDINIINEINRLNNYGGMITDNALNIFKEAVDKINVFPNKEKITANALKVTQNKAQKEEQNKAQKEEQNKAQKNKDDIIKLSKNIKNKIKEIHGFIKLTKNKTTSDDDKKRIKDIHNSLTYISNQITTNTNITYLNSILKVLNVFNKTKSLDELSKNLEINNLSQSGGGIFSRIKNKLYFRLTQENKMLRAYFTLGSANKSIRKRLFSKYRGKKADVIYTHSFILIAENKVDPKWVYTYEINNIKKTISDMQNDIINLMNSKNSRTYTDINEINDTIKKTLKQIVTTSMFNRRARKKKNAVSNNSKKHKHIHMVSYQSLDNILNIPQSGGFKISNMFKKCKKKKFIKKISNNKTLKRKTLKPSVAIPNISVAKPNISVAKPRTTKRRVTGKLNKKIIKRKSIIAKRKTAIKENAKKQRLAKKKIAIRKSIAKKRTILKQKATLKRNIAKKKALDKHKQLIKKRKKKLYKSLQKKYNSKK